jgi:hypothetical protein
MSPLDAFKRAMFYISSVCSQRFINKPGVIIEHLSDDTRLELRKLKSSDIDGSSERLDDLKYFVGSDEYYRNKEFEKDRLEFDKKIAKEIPTPKKY